MVVGHGSFTGNSTGADTDGDASCVPATAFDVWFSHTPAVTWNVDVDTFGSSFDTVLSVHTGCPGTSANEIACNDDAGDDFQSQVTFVGTAGTTYLIRVAGWDDVELGPLVLNIAGVTGPPNDMCAGATAVGEGSFTGNTQNASTDGATTCDDPDDDSGKDVWHEHTPGTGGVLTIDTFGSLFDTVLSVHTGCPGTEANEVICNDDNGGFFQSRVSFAVTAGMPYLIRIAGYESDSGPYTLNIFRAPPVPNDRCENATVVGDGTFNGTTLGADTDGSTSCVPGHSSNDAWLQYTPPLGGSVTIDTVGSQFDTVLSVHAGCPGTAGNEVACNDDRDEFTTDSEVTFWRLHREDRPDGAGPGRHRR
jgi:hypothetical protein